MQCAARLLLGFYNSLASWVMYQFFLLLLRDRILQSTVIVLVLPANVRQTFPFGNFNFKIRVFTGNVSWQHRRHSWSGPTWDCRAVWDNKYQHRKPIAQQLLEAHPWIPTHTHTHTHRYKQQHCVIPKSLSTLAGSIETESCPCPCLKNCLSVCSVAMLVVVIRSMKKCKTRFSFLFLYLFSNQCF